MARIPQSTLAGVLLYTMISMVYATLVTNFKTPARLASYYLIRLQVRPSY